MRIQQFLIKYTIHHENNDLNIQNNNVPKPDIMKIGGEIVEKNRFEKNKEILSLKVAFPYNTRISLWLNLPNDLSLYNVLENPDK